MSPFGPAPTGGPGGCDRRAPRLALQLLGGVLAIVLAASLLASASASATPQLTSPAEGQTVMNAKGGAITFHWVLPEGETEPAVFVGDTPSYDSNPESQDYLAPFAQYCAADFGEAVTFCTIPGGTPFTPGTHYAFVDSRIGSETLISPVVRFVVPVEMGWGCSPAYPRCGHRQLYNEYIPGGDASYPWTTDVIKVSGWSNASSLAFVFTLTRGHRLIKQLHTAISREAEEIAFPGVKIFHVPGLPPSTPLTLTIEMSAGGVTASRSVKVRSGGGPKHGVTLY